MLCQKTKLTPSCLTMMMVALLLSVVADETAAQTSRGTIRGQLTVDGGRSVERIPVRLIVEGSGATMQTVNTNSEGAFVFTDLPPRPYRVSAYIPGYVSGRPTLSRVLRIGDEVRLHLTKGGVITGRIIGEEGAPVVAAPVTAMRVRSEDGKLLNNPQQPVPATRTDDRGIYRIFGLPTGVYVVVANWARSSITTGSGYEEYLPVYHPSSSRAEAGEVKVDAGTEVSGIDIRFVRTFGHSISGTIETQYDLKRDNTSSLSALLSQYPDGGAVGSGFVNVLGGSREFFIPGVADGEYEINASGRLNRDEMLTGPPQRVTVRGRDVTGVRLTAVPYGAIVGRLVIEELAPALADACRARPSGATGEIVIRAARVRRPNENRSTFYYSFPAIPAEEGGFTLRNLQAGEYRLDISLPGERWYVRDLTGEVVRRRGYPVNFNRLPLRVNYGETLVGLKVTLGDGAATFEGKVDMADGSQRVRVHLVPAEPSAADDLPRYAETTADREGRFRLHNLAPGRYRVLALRVQESPDETRLPLAWHAGERARLRTLAQTAGRDVALQPCRVVKDVILQPIPALR